MAACATPRDASTSHPPRAIVVGPDRERLEPLMAPALRLIEQRRLTLRRDVTVRTHERADDFVADSMHAGLELRAWTTFEIVDLAPLAQWTNRDDKSVTARLAHELCHAAIYQGFGSEERARAARIPRFFSEGTCAIVAGQPAPAFVDDGVNALTIETFESDPVRAYRASYLAMQYVEKRLGPLGFAKIVDEAAADGTVGCVERALQHELGMTIPQLWQAVLDDEASSQ